jgi:hypothetical protein
MKTSLALSDRAPRCGKARVWWRCVVCDGRLSLPPLSIPPRHRVLIPSPRRRSLRGRTASSHERRRACVRRTHCSARLVRQCDAVPATPCSAGHLGITEQGGVRCDARRGATLRLTLHRTRCPLCISCVRSSPVGATMSQQLTMHYTLPFAFSPTSA